MVFAPVSSLPADNFEHFQRREGDPVAAEIEAEHGSPGQNPRFWREAAPRTYVDRVTEPLLILHGTADDTCPPRWSEETAAAFKDAGKDVRLVRYPGEGHTFSARWPDSMETSLDFFDRHLR
ncbi:alpha/beta hydrolase family protein [Streptomyces sp. NPDC057877]|uniref:alpha/beta hydrolase family protein n=1 Tax=Streptomyces sp. NPDC057877 TaxID=3346269 RepID=UPI003683DAA5